MKWLSVFGMVLVFFLVGCQVEVESKVISGDDISKKAKLDRFKQLVEETDKIIEEDKENAQEILTVGLSRGDVPPDFTVTGVEGNVISLHEELEKGYPTLVYFFATWCPECRNDFEELEKLYEEYAEDVTIIAISKDLNEGKEKLVSFKEQYPGLENLRVALGTKKILKDYNVIYTTTKYSINDQGKVEYFGSGELSEEQWITLLEGMKKKEKKELTII